MWPCAGDQSFWEFNTAASCCVQKTLSYCRPHCLMNCTSFHPLSPMLPGSFLDRASDVDVPCISEPSLNTWFLNFDQLWVSLLVAVHYTKMLSLWDLKAALICGSRDRYLEGNRSRLTFRASELSSCVFLARLTVTAMSFFLWSGPESIWLSPIIFMPLLSPWTYHAKPVIIGAQSKNHRWVRLWNHHFKNLTHT